MLKAKLNIVFVLLLTLGVSIYSRESQIIHMRFLQSKPLRVSVSTYLSAPVSTESLGCFLDTIGNLTMTLETKVDEYSKLCDLKNNPNVQMLFNIVSLLGVFQGQLILDPKYSLTDKDIANLQTYNSSILTDIITTKKLTDELIDVATKMLHDKWDSIAKSNKYPIFLKNNGWDLALFVQGLNTVKTAYQSMPPTTCVPVTKDTIEIFENSVVDLVDKEPPLIEKEIIDDKVTIDPNGFTYGGYALGFWVSEDNSILVHPYKILQGFINNVEELTFSIADGSIIHTLTIGDDTVFVRENPKCTEYAFVLLVIEKDCDQYNVRLIIRLSNLNTRYMVTKSVNAEVIENLQITLLENMALSPMFFTHFVYSEPAEKRVLSEMLEVFHQNIVQFNNDCKKADEKCLYYSNENKCQVCSDGLFQFNDKCYKQCPDGTFKTEEQQCEQCTSSCKNCLDIDTCGQCLTGFYLINGDCVKNCPSNTFPFNSTCTVCDDKCSVCLNEKDCSKCIPPNVLYQGKCLPQCPIQTFKDSLNSNCINCQEGCKVCSSTIQCSECLDKYYNLNNKCVKECGNGYRKDDATKTCIKCIDNCKDCTQDGKCDNCNDGYLLSTDSKCVSHCDDGQVSFKKICIDCLDKQNCITCNPNNVAMCESCKDPKVLKAGQCLDNCGDYYYKTSDNKCTQCKNNCKTCSKDTCLQCDDGKFLLENEKCVSPCPDGYVASGTVCKKCTDLTCKKCSETALDACTACYPPQLIKEGDCVDTCGLGYYKKNDKCEKCITGCLVCKDNYTCDTCDKNYFMKNSVCVTSCGEGMKPNMNAVCELCTVGDCSQCDKDKTVCDKCKNGKVLYNNQCYDKCPSGSYLPPNSLICQKCSPHCQNCVNGDSCQQCENKYVLQDTSCLTICKDGFYPNDKNICTPCTNPNCKKCPATPSKCTECPDNLLLFNGDCVKQCPSGTYQSNNQCITCKVPCSTCDTAADNCTTCITPFVLQANQCLDNCRPGFANVNGVCKKCTDNNCDKCKPDNIDCCIKPAVNYVVDNCDVFDKCKDGKFSDLNGVCQNCLPNCQKCAKDTTCLQCKSGFFLKNDNSCVQTCGDGWIESSGKCLPCSSKCNKCKVDDTTCCTVCKDNQFSLNCECLSECPKKYWKNVDHCSPCSINDCADCVNQGTVCNKCSNGFVLLDGKCIPSPCPDGTMENNGKCEKCLVDNCKICPKSTQTCKECKTPYSLVNDYQCALSCPEKTYSTNFPNNAALYCDSCGLHCSTCKNKDICQKCENGFVLQEGRCQTKCDDGYRNENGKCVPCSFTNCQQCSKDACIACGQNYFLDTEAIMCFGVCPETKFADSLTRQCKHCSQYCKTCVDGTTCKECQSPYVLDLNNKCTDQCPDKTVNVDGKCTLCKTSDHCNKCGTDLVTCVQCEGNYLLKNNNCVVDCGNNYYKDNGKCYPCKNTCKTCKDATSCDECTDGNYLLNHNCSPQCPDGYYKGNKECVPCTTNCVQCTSDKCLHCKTGNYLENGKCVSKCSTGYFLFNEFECQPCSDKCIQCQSKESCTQCAPSLYLSNGYCVDKCPAGEMPVNMKCTKCTDHCTVCGSTLDQCSKCETGYYLYNGKCVKDCPANFYETVDKCSACILRCDQCQDNVSCDVCSNGYVLFTNNNITRCDEKCPEGYSVYNKQCVQCTADNCKTCDTTKDKCTLCTDITYRYQDKCVVKCPSKTYVDGKECKNCPTECDQCSNVNSCTKCINGFFLDSRKCVSKCSDGSIPVSGECKDCTTDDCSVCLASDLSKCTKCQKNLFLKKLPENDTVCVDDCGDGFFVDNFECKPCNNDLCKTCPNSDQCVKCIEGKVLQGKICQDKCNDFFVERNNECKECKDKNCLVCDNINLDKCKKCVLPYFLENEKCVPQCDVGFYAVDMANQKQCLTCINNCDKCTNSETCQKCTAPFLLFNGKCVSQCESGYAEVKGECKKCTQDNCLVCLSTNLDKCIKCKPNTFLNTDSVCVDDCGKSFYAVNGVCKPCTDVNCISCSPENVCNKCTNGKFLFNGQCVNTCPLSTYADSNGECKPCTDSNCQVCVPSNPTVCKTCLIGYLLDGQCVSKCPDGTFVNSQKQCQQCGSNCMKCIDEQTCDICKTGFFVTDKNTCTDDCSTGSVAIDGKCVKCTDDKCDKCSAKDVSICDECDPTLFLYKGKCLPTCIDGTFISGRNCKDCEKNCKKCTDEVTCINCYSPFSEYKADCVVDCPSGWISNGTTCKKCKDDNCNKCADNLEYCNDCKLPLLNDQGKCIDKCDIGKFYNNDKKKCDYCITGCENCPDATSCVKCDSTHVLVIVTGKCETTCPKGYYQDMKTNSCVKCDNNTCDKCDPLNPLSCTDCPVKMLKLTDKNNNVQCIDQCPDQFYQKDDKCFKCVAPCNLCKDNSTCINCIAPYKLEDTQCLNDCPEGTVERNGVCYKCQDDGCKNCDPNDLTKCLNCIKPKILFQNDCIDKCPDNYYLSDALTCVKCDSSCSTCDKKGCLTCLKGLYFYEDTKNCVDCSAPNVIVGDACKKCKIDGCAQCSKTDITICNLCQSGFVSFEKKCLPQCPYGYYKNGTTCAKCADTCSECTAIDQCTVCKDGKIKFGGQCIDSCPDFYLNNNGICEACTQSQCMKCDPNPSTCIKCKDYPLLDSKCVEKCPDGYTLSGDKCTKCSTNCNKCDNSQCYECTIGKIIKGTECVADCGEGFYTDSKTCIPCSDTNCLSCTDSKTCKKCKNDTFLNTLTMTCSVTCPDGFYGNKDTKKCTKCDEGCDKCKPDGCIQCSEAYAFFGTKCVKPCPSGYTPVNQVCVKCTQDSCSECVIHDPDTCVKCKTFLNKGVCVDTCPNGTFAKNFICTPCDSKCDKCQDEKTCLKCKDEFALLQGQCTNKCGDGKVKIEGKCVACSQDTCQECTIDITKCIKCTPPSVLSNTQCIKNCPSGTFKDMDLNKCIDCPRSCATCSQNACQQCNPGYYMFQGQCLTNCPVGFYEDCSPDTRQCKPCNVACNKCVLGTNANCIECAKDYFLYNELCIKSTECPDGTYYNGTTCTKCAIQYCQTCSNADTCLKCNRGFILQNGKCLEKHTLTPIISDFTLVSPYTSATPSIRQKETLPISNYQGTGVGSVDVTFSFYLRLLSPKIETQVAILTILNNQLSAYNFKFIIDPVDTLCKMTIEDLTKAFTYTLPIGSCTYVDLIDWQYYSINLSKDGDNFIARVDTIDSTGKVVEKTLKVPNNSRTNVLEPSATIVLNYYTGKVNSPSNAAYHIGKLMVMDYYPTVDQFIALSKLLPSNCDYFCTSCKNVCLTCIGGVLPTDNKCSPYFIRLNEGNPVYFDGKSSPVVLRDQLDHEGLVSTAYGLTTWFYVKDPTINNQNIYQVHFNNHQDKYQYLKVEIVNSTLSIDNVIVSNMTLSPNQWYFLYVSNTEDQVEVVIRDTNQTESSQIIKSLPYFIIHYDDFIYEFGKNFKGSIFNTKIYINNVPTQDELEIEYGKLKCPKNCDKCADDLKCSQCQPNYDLTKEGLCVEQEIKVTPTILENMYDIWNKKGKMYKITSIDNKFTISLMLRKKTHSNIYQNYNNHNILSYISTDKTKIKPLLTEKLTKEYESEFAVVGDIQSQSWKHDFSEEVYDFIHVIMIVNNDTKKITFNTYDYLIDKSIVFTTDFTSPLLQLVIGDPSGYELNIEYSNMLFYPVLATQKLIDTLRKHPVPCDPICKDCNWSNGKCNVCYTDPNPSGGDCPTYVFGYHPASLYGYHKFSDLQIKDDYKFLLKDYFPLNFNAEKYSVYFIGKFYRFYEGIKYRIGCIINDSYRLFTPIENRGKNLMCFDVFIKNGKGSLEMILNDGGSFVTVPIKGFEVQPLHWLSGYIGVNTIDKSLKYAFITDLAMSSKITGEYKYIHVPEKIQESAGLTLYGAFDSLDDKLYAPPEILLEHYYIYPYNGYSEDDLTMMIQEQPVRENPQCDDGCKICSWEEDKANCVECKPGYMTVVTDAKKKINVCKKIEFSYISYNDGIITQKKDYPISNPIILSGNFGLYFQIIKNFLYYKPEETRTIIQLGALKLALYKDSLYIIITQDVKALEIPLNDSYNSWNHVFLYKNTNTITVTIQQGTYTKTVTFTSDLITGINSKSIYVNPLNSEVYLYGFILTTSPEISTVYQSEPLGYSSCGLDCAYCFNADCKACSLGSDADGKCKKGKINLVPLYNSPNTNGLTAQYDLFESFDPKRFMRVDQFNLEFNVELSKNTAQTLLLSLQDEAATQGLKVFINSTIGQLIFETLAPQTYYNSTKETFNVALPNKPATVFFFIGIAYNKGQMAVVFAENNSNVASIEFKLQYPIAVLTYNTVANFFSLCSLKLTNLQFLYEESKTLEQLKSKVPKAVKLIQKNCLIGTPSSCMKCNPNSVLKNGLCLSQATNAFFSQVTEYVQVGKFSCSNLADKFKNVPVLSSFMLSFNLKLTTLMKGKLGILSLTNKNNNQIISLDYLPDQDTLSVSFAMLNQTVKVTPVQSKLESNFEWISIAMTYSVLDGNVLIVLTDKDGKTISKTSSTIKTSQSIDPKEINFIFYYSDQLEGSFEYQGVAFIPNANYKEAELDAYRIDSIQQCKVACQDCTLGFCNQPINKSYDFCRQYKKTTGILLNYIDLSAKKFYSFKQYQLTFELDKDYFNKVIYTANPSTLFFLTDSVTVDSEGLSFNDPIPKPLFNLGLSVSLVGDTLTFKKPILPWSKNTPQTFSITLSSAPLTSNLYVTINCDAEINSMKIFLSYDGKSYFYDATFNGDERVPTISFGSLIFIHPAMDQFYINLNAPRIEYDLYKIGQSPDFNCVSENQDGYCPDCKSKFKLFGTGCNLNIDSNMNPKK